MSFTVTDRQNYLLERERLPQNDAAVFVEARLAGQSQFVRNEGLDRIVTIDEDRALTKIRFVFQHLYFSLYKFRYNTDRLLFAISSSDLWKQADIEKQQIFDLMDKEQAKLQRKHGKSSQVLTTNVRKATWSQVLNQVNTTAQQWSQSRKASNISVSIDKIGRNSDAFQAWLQLLPGGDYGSRCVSPFFFNHASRMTSALS